MSNLRQNERTQMILDNTFLFTQQHNKITCTSVRRGGILLAITYYIFCHCMEKHSSHNEAGMNTSHDSQKFNPRFDLSPEMQNLENIAAKYYAPYVEKVKENDDAQESFTSGAEHFLNGLQLTSKIASRAKNAEHTIH